MQIGQITVKNIQYNNAIYHREKEIPQRYINSNCLPSFADAKSFVNISFKANNMEELAYSCDWVSILNEINNGANVNTPVNVLNETLLHIFCKRKYKGMVKNLLEIPGVDVDAKDVYGKKAIEYGGMEIAQMIKTYKKDNDSIKKQIVAGVWLPFQQIWSEDERKKIEELIKAQKFTEVINIFEEKGKTLNGEYVTLRTQLERIREELEKTVREQLTPRIRQEEEVRAQKGLEAQRQTMEADLEAKRVATEAALEEQRKTTEADLAKKRKTTEADLEAKRKTTEAALQKREKAVERKEAALQKKKAALEQTIKNKTDKAFAAERAAINKYQDALDKRLKNMQKDVEQANASRKEALDEREQGLNTREQGLDTRKKGLDDREEELKEGEAALKQGNATLATLMGNFDGMVAEEVAKLMEENASELMLLYGVNIPEKLPENMEYIDQVTYVMSVLVPRQEKLNDVNDDMPDRITKALQDDGGNISSMGLKFLENIIDSSSKNCSEQDLVDAIKAVKGSYGLFDTKKVKLFLQTILWGKNKTIQSAIQKVQKFAV